MRGHEEASGTAYVPKQLFEEWAAQGPGRCASRQLLLERGVLARRRARRASARELKPRIDALVDEALAAPDPGSDARSASSPTSTPPACCAPRRRPRRAAGAAPELRYVDAIRDGLREAMRARPDAWSCWARTSPSTAASSRSPRASSQEFGKARVRNTPIIESGALGAALGLALDGFVPDGRDAVRRLHHLRLQPDRQQPGQDALPLGRARCRSWCACRSGGGVGAGPFHSQNVEAWFTQRRRPQGGGARDALRRQGPAAGRLRGRQPRPLPRAQAPLPLGEGPRARRATTRCPSGAARVARAGPRRHRRHLRRRRARGRSRPPQRLAAEGARDRGDRPAHAAAVGPRDGARARCARRAARSSCTRRRSPAASAARWRRRSGTEAFEWLDAPVARLGALDTPVPFSKALEEVFSPRRRLLRRAAGSAGRRKCPTPTTRLPNPPSSWPWRA